jgi:hypothetical protein
MRVQIEECEPSPPDLADEQRVADALAAAQIARTSGLTGRCPRTPEVHARTCGARTRAGTACKIRSFWSNGRCKLHGGASTGPKTEQGRQQSAVNGRKGGRPRKPVDGQKGENLTP